MKISLKTVFMPLIFTLLLSFFITDYAEARPRSFPAGSYIIPADACWQPNSDPNMATQDPMCETNKNDKSIFQMYGLLYALLDVGDQPGLCKNNDNSTPQQKAMFGYCKQIRVYWMIDAEKTDQHANDLLLSTTDPTINTKGIVQIFNGNLTKAGTNAKPVAYRGGPFVIDANDITTAEMNKIIAKFPTVKIHKANIPFSGNVDKVLVGKPPKVAVLDEIPKGQSNVSSDVLEDYIRASGLYSWKGTVFQKLSARDVIAGCLRDPLPASCKARRPDLSSAFQLLWAPHWIIEDKWSDGSWPTAAEQTAVIKEIREFFERGNSGFFQCASIGSLEGSHILGYNYNIGQDISAGVGGLLVDKEKTWPRLDTNGGCFKGYSNSSSGNCASDYLQFEAAPFWLTQCGGWEFKPGQGAIDSMRPNAASDYLYHTTDKAVPAKHYVGDQLTRFIHDNPDKLRNKYGAGSGTSSGYYVYDYLVGGRINGSPTQGYVIYFPGHKYITCENRTEYDYPPSRNIDFQFNRIPEGTIKVELVHNKCSESNNCPTVSYGSGNSTDLVAADNWLTLSAEFAFLNSGSKSLEGIYFTSNFYDNVATELQISKIKVFFDGGDDPDPDNRAKLLSVTDVTQAGSRQVLCSPNATATATTPVECSGTYIPTTILSMNFDGDISDTPSKPVKIIIPIKNQSNRLEATYNLATKVGTRSSTVGNLTLDLTNALYDSATNTLGNILLERGSNCADVTLTDILVDFPGAGIKMVAVYNNSTNEEVCTANSTTVAVCSTPQTPLPDNSIKTSLNFNNSYLGGWWSTNNTNIALKINYDCNPACDNNSISYALYYTDSRSKSGTRSENTDIILDMSKAYFTNSNRNLSNIIITNKNQSKQMVITGATLYYDRTKGVVDFRDTTNNSALIATFPKQSPATTSATHVVKNYTTIETPESYWSYLIGRGICNNYKISPYMSSCTIDWKASYGNGKASNTCGAKYVLNTFLALKFQIVSNEFSKTQPIVKNNIMYKASYDYPEYRGHLRMIKVPTNTQAAQTIWDAAERMPAAGDSGFKSAPLSSKDSTSPRYIFTTEPGGTTRENFDANNWAKLKGLLTTSDEASTKALINSVRGRADATVNNPFGTKEANKRLWAIESSTPALKTISRYVESTAADVTQQSIDAGRDRRDRIIFAGAADGMMHAFWAGSYDANTLGYPDTTTGRGDGKEIWAYIPSTLLPVLQHQPFDPDPKDEATFEPKVHVDGSPSLADFLICKNRQGSFCSSWVWETRLVGTARIDNANRGVVFALDVTDPYDPKPLWETSYDDTSATACSGINKNCNMGNSKGVAIGSTQVGSELKNYAYLTSSWISRKNSTKPLKINNKEVDGQYETCSDANNPDCVFGVTAYALDLENGNIVWTRDLPYTGDAVNVNHTPAVPALMDRDNNGSYDYVVFGDMQGRLWALRTTDGKNLTGNDPVYEVKKLDAQGKDTTVKAGAEEPIGASVAVYRDNVVLATGGADSAKDGDASDPRTYRVEVIKISQKGATKLDNFTILLDQSTDEVKSEKVWAQPAITADSKIYIVTARNYTSASSSMVSVGSEGRVIVMDLKKERASNVTPLDATTAEADKTNVTVVEGAEGQWIKGGFVGGLDFDSKHGYVVTLNPDSKDAGKSFIQLGNRTDFKSSFGSTNPYKVLWWKKL